MFKNKHLSKALSDAAISSILTMLKYKSDWYGRVIVSIDRFIPSTKRCSECGGVLKQISLSTRKWICPHCGTHHDRDINAARNILYYAELKYNELKRVS